MVLERGRAGIPVDERVALVEQKGGVDVRGMKKSGLLHADIDKCGLDPRQDRNDLAPVNVPLEPHAVGPFDHEFDDLFVFKERRAFFGGRCVKKNLFHNPLLKAFILN